MQEVVKSFRVDDIRSLRSRKYITIQAENLNGDDWTHHCNKSKGEMHSRWTNIKKGIKILEIHEIDRIVGNTVHLKTPVVTPLNSKYKIGWKALTRGYWR